MPRTGIKLLATSFAAIVPAILPPFIARSLTSRCAEASIGTAPSRRSIASILNLMPALSSPAVGLLTSVTVPRRRVPAGTIVRPPASIGARRQAWTRSPHPRRPRIEGVVELNLYLVSFRHQGDHRLPLLPRPRTTRLLLSRRARRLRAYRRRQERHSPSSSRLPPDRPRPPPHRADAHPRAGGHCTTGSDPSPPPRGETKTPEAHERRTDGPGGRSRGSDVPAVPPRIIPRIIPVSRQNRNVLTPG